MEYPLWVWLGLGVVKKLLVKKKGKKKYTALMGFDTRKSAMSYLRRYKEKGMEGFVRKAPQFVTRQFPEVKWVVYEWWSDEYP